jgi:signal transduction histidine kinase
LKSLGIKFKIAALIALLLLVGMLLLDMVMVYAAQRLLIKSEKEKGRVLVELIGAYALSGQGTDGGPAGGGTDRIRSILSTSDVAWAMWVDSSGRGHWLLGQEDATASALERVSQIALNQDSQKIDMVGTTWGIFWRQNKYLVVSSPFYENQRVAGAAGVAIRLDSVFEQLRNAQKFIGYYLLINTLILSLVGLVRIHQLALRPVLKIIGRAEAFRPGDAAFSLEENGENELARLSRAINRVFDLNREDQEKLKQTVNRLEDAMVRLKQAQQEIIRAEKLATVGRLSSGVAHEIGNPIGIVMGYLELIKQGTAKDEETREYIKRAEDEVQRIRSIIRQLLDYSRPSEAEREIVPIHPLIGDVVDMALVQPLFADLTVEAELAADCDTVSGDPDQLKQLFLNFILNSADAIRMSGKDVPGRIRIASENVEIQKTGGGDGPKALHVHFEDNGSGISEADLNRIFDPFFTTKPTGMGSGLGLWVSLLIVEAMGGTIAVKSSEGEGTRITLVLPAA